MCINFTVTAYANINIYICNTMTNMFIFIHVLVNVISLELLRPHIQASPPDRYHPWAESHSRKGTYHLRNEKIYKPGE